MPSLSDIVPDGSDMYAAVQCSPSLWGVGRN